MSTETKGANVRRAQEGFWGRGDEAISGQSETREGEMEEQVIGPEEQVASVLQALQRLQATKCFRGQAELVGDTRDHLERLLHSPRCGEMEPRPMSHASPWLWVAAMVLLLTGAVLVLLRGCDAGVSEQSHPAMVVLPVAVSWISRGSAVQG